MKKYIVLFWVLLYTATYYPLIFKIRSIRKRLGQKKSRAFLNKKAKQWANRVMKIFNYTVEVIGYENLENCNGTFIDFHNL